jgi:hypothetical protein
MAMVHRLPSVFGGESSSLISNLHYNDLHDDSEITNISCKYISFLQDFVNFKSFLRKKPKDLLKEWSKDAAKTEGQ